MATSTLLTSSLAWHRKGGPVGRSPVRLGARLLVFVPLSSAPSLTDAFVLLPAGQVGNSRRNTLRGPHTNIFDAALMREFPLGSERPNLEFRSEIFNLTNTPHFGQRTATSAAEPRGRSLRFPEIHE